MASKSNFLSSSTTMASKSNFLSFVSLLILLCICFPSSSGNVNVLHKHKHKHFHRKRIVPNYPSIVVDPFGHGDFSTIQAAINHVPVNNLNWIRIFVKAGNYSEQVNIPREKPYIYLKGDGKWRTRVNWDGFGNIQTCATFISAADNIVVKSISFINTYNYPVGSKKNEMRPAVTATIAGDKCAFYRVGFVGLQDTLWDVQGRHYFSHCTIQGAVDFIFGSGQSIYSRCVISVVAGALPAGLAGFITAQGRSDPSETSGFIFKKCNIVGNGMTFLGRPWREYARVIFFNSNFWDIIVPQGWDIWMTQGHEHQLTFAEYGCHGKGANTTQRVSWEYKMNEDMVRQLSSISFVDQEGWINNLPLELAI